MIRKVVLSLLYFLGLIRLLIFVARKRNVTILVVHQVVNAEEGLYDPLRRILTPDILEKHIRFLSKYYRLVSYPDAVAMIAGERPVEPNSLCLTFDDGYRNNISKAYPILHALDIPFTIFLTTGLIENRQPMWVDRLDYAFGAYNGAPVKCTLNGVALELAGSDWEQKFNSFAHFRHTAKSVDCDDFDFLNVMAQTAKTLECQIGRSIQDIWENDDVSVLLTWDDLLGEDRPLISYGSHTCDHVRLCRVSPERARAQLEDSKKIIQLKTKQPCVHFAYPDGDYSDTISAMVKDCGYVSAVTSREGLNSVGSDLFQLARIPLPIESSEVELLSRVSGLSLTLSKVKEFLWLDRSKDD